MGADMSGIAVLPPSVTGSPHHKTNAAFRAIKSDRLGLNDGLSTSTIY